MHTELPPDEGRELDEDDAFYVNIAAISYLTRPSHASRGKEYQVYMEILALAPEGRDCFWTRESRFKVGHKTLIKHLRALQRVGLVKYDRLRGGAIRFRGFRDIPSRILKWYDAFVADLRSCICGQDEE